MCGIRRDGEKGGGGGGLKGSVYAFISLINVVNTSAFPGFFVDFTL